MSEIPAELTGTKGCVADRNRQRPPAVRQSSSSTSTTATASHTSSRSPPGGDTTSMGSRSYRHGQQQRLTLTLVTISTLWMLLSLPYALVENEGGIFKFEVAPVTRIVCYLLMYSNHAVNFFVYCLLGRKFRTELKRAFGFDKYARRSAALADGRRVLRQSSWQPTFSHQHNTFMPCCCLVSRDRERHKQGLDEAVRDVSALAPGINGSNKSDGNKHPL